MKKLLKIVGALALLVVIALVVVFFFIDSIVKAGVEKGSTAALGVETTLDKASVSFTASSLRLTKLDISNPTGFSKDKFFSLGDCLVACDVPTILKDEVVVEKIIVDAPVLTIERSGTTTNLAAIMSNLDGGKKVAAAPAKPAAREKAFRVKLLKVTNAKVRFLLIDGKPIDVAVPEIEIKDLKNKDNSPLLFADLFYKLITATAEAGAKNGKGIVPDEYLKLTDGALGRGTDIIRETIKDPGSIIKDPKKTIEDVNGIIKDAEGIFKKKKK